jgi:hypothetical protein
MLMLVLFLKFYLIIFICSLNLCWLSINTINELIKRIIIFTKYANEVCTQSIFSMCDEDD